MAATSWCSLFYLRLSIVGREPKVRSDMMNIPQLKALQQYYADELAKHATLRAPSNFQLHLQTILFGHHQRVTEMLGRLL
ncbi:hypothetical protein C2O24_20285 [Salmonella enterica]|nr:hypothetical protein [Salmonella enterica]EBD6270307.1 hypothetical protein [Salmonella enterica]EGG9947084.1 hypothetical protein [Salmonella enterica]EHW8175945.1 hypothetical protein [Salmonella enterica]EKA4564551.1 hypothetical protein [Salmonella enterica]